MRLRHVTLITDQPERVLADLEATFGLEVSLNEADMIEMWGPGMVDEFRLRTSVLPVGDTFLEVISPTHPETTASRYLASRGGGTGYMVIVQSDAIAAARERASRLGIREVWEGPLENVRSVHFDPRGTGGSLLSLEEPTDPEDWPWAGPRWRDHVRTDVVSKVVGAEIIASSPASVADRWGQLLERPVDENEQVWTVDLSDGELRFIAPTDGRPDGLAVIDLACSDPDLSRRRAAERGLRLRDDGAILLGGVAFRVLTV